MEKTENQKQKIVSFILGLIIVGCFGAIQLLMIYGRHDLAYAITILMGYFSIGVVVITLYKIRSIETPQR